MTRPYRVVVAPDKFKGSLSAGAVADVLADTLARCSHVEVVRHPVADGGEGTVDLALSAGFEPVTVEVKGPLKDPVSATFAMRDTEAVIEMASAAGLDRLARQPDPETAWSATTHGVGELVLAALDRGATQVVVGVGGSATTDGGRGALEALGCDVAMLKRTADRVAKSDAAIDRRLSRIDLVVACDVDNPLVGPTGAAAVYAPQKGADPECVARLGRRLTAWADTVTLATGQDLRLMPGAGAAGGLAFGLVAVAGARLVSGAEFVVELTDFEDIAASADLVIVGEGSLDRQSLRGKGPVGVARAASRRGTTVIAVAGRNELTESEQEMAGLSAVYPLSDVESDPEVCMRDARRVLSVVAKQIASNWLGRPRNEGRL